MYSGRVRNWPSAWTYTCHTRRAGRLRASPPVTKALAKFFATQGWITEEQVEKYHRLMP